MVKELEQEATSNFVKEQCGYCDHVLLIPKEVYNEIALQREKTGHNIGLSMRGRYNDAYISNCGYFYCNDTCFTRFTED
ncbi:MAG: hypothetical protein Q7S33_02260 [Nanoarchaeota archaeon]|nr:hypothetical protein [Nanoarchaeota archaeon]